MVNWFFFSVRNLLNSITLVNLSSFLLCYWSILQKILAYSIYLWTGNIKCGSEPVNQTVLRYYLLLLLLFLMLFLFCEFTFMHEFHGHVIQTEVRGRLGRDSGIKLGFMATLCTGEYCFFSGISDVGFPFQGIIDLERFSNCFQSSLYFVSSSVIWT